MNIHNPTYNPNGTCALPSICVSKTKKKLEIDPLHANTLRLIYRLFLEGDARRREGR